MALSIDEAADEVVAGKKADDPRRLVPEARDWLVIAPGEEL